MASLLRLLAPALPLLVGLGLWRFVRRRRTVADRLGDPRLIRLIATEELYRAPRLRIALALGAALALAGAVADPRWGTAEAEEEVRGGPVVMVVDVSTSMLVEDLPPSRLARARAAVRRLARSMPESAVGVVVFAGRAYALTPPTTDPAALELFLDALDPAMATQTGSSLAAAIRQGIGLLAAGQGDAGALVLVTDGNTQEAPSDIEAALQLARRAGITVHVLGVGTAAGGPVPSLDLRSGRRDGFVREPGGEVAISRLDESLLLRVAEQTGGEYVALSGESSVERLAGVLRASSGKAGGRQGGERPPRYAPFAAAALLLLVGESLVSAGSRRRVA